jgi:hypothetical protein
MIPSAGKAEAPKCESWVQPFKSCTKTFNMIKQRILKPRANVFKIGHGMGWNFKHLKWVGL